MAAWCGGPSWAEIGVRLGPGGLLGAYLGLAAARWIAAGMARRRRLARARDGIDTAVARRGYAAAPRERLAAPPPLAVAGVGLALVAGLWTWGSSRGGADAAAPAAGLRVEVLDVGQGDAILLRPRAAAPVLVDGGPPGEDLAERLRGEGVGRLAAAVATHDQSDHTGGLTELFGRLPVERLVYARVGRELRDRAAAAGAVPTRVAAGATLRSGALRLEALWPPAALLSAPAAGVDPNQRSLVLLVRWHRFSMLLGADAEAEAVPLEPGPVDVLKVAHHGSDDAGLSALLARSRPGLAVISVGDGNPFGHPTAATVATLAEAGVPVMRTDRDGTVAIDVSRRGFRVDAGH